MEIYEYKIFKPVMKRGLLKKDMDPAELETQINDLGARGWELAATIPISGNAMVASYGSSTTDVIFIFKRKIR